MGEIIRGVGIDLIETSRIESALAQHGASFLKRVFLVAEQEYAQRFSRPAVHFAARWAAKEAVSKAAGTGIGSSMLLTDIEICHDANGAPQVVMHGAGKEWMRNQRISRILISLTHTEHYAAATAMLIESDQ